MVYAYIRRYAIRGERWRQKANDRLFDIMADLGQQTHVIEQHPRCLKPMMYGGNPFDLAW